MDGIKAPRKVKCNACQTDVRTIWFWEGYMLCTECYEKRGDLFEIEKDTSLPTNHPRSIHTDVCMVGSGTQVSE